MLSGYPAVTKAVHCAGHTSKVGCHLCRYNRGKKGGNMSWYGRDTGKSARSSRTRTMWRYKALKASGACSDELQKLGFTTRLDSPSSHPLHLISEQLISWKYRIPRDTYGKPVVSCTFDPYRSCLIAPDRVLCGHWKDIANCLLGMMKIPKKRVELEKFALNLLRRAGYDNQHRLLNSMNKALLSLTTTQVYSLTVILPNALVQVLCKDPQDLFSNIKNRFDYSEKSTILEMNPSIRKEIRMAMAKFECAVEVLHPGSTLLSMLCESDSNDIGNGEVSCSGAQAIMYNRMKKLQKSILKHVKRVQKLCEFLEILEPFTTLKVSRTHPKFELFSLQNVVELLWKFQEEWTSRIYIDYTS